MNFTAKKKNKPKNITHTQEADVNRVLKPLLHKADNVDDICNDAENND